MITEVKSDQMAWKILAICCLKCYLDRTMKIPVEQTFLIPRYSNVIVIP